jgi:hypothetical protein
MKSCAMLGKGQMVTNRLGNGALVSRIVVGYVTTRLHRRKCKCKEIIGLTFQYTLHTTHNTNFVLRYFAADAKSMIGTGTDPAQGAGAGAAGVGAR